MPELTLEELREELTDMHLYVAQEFAAIKDQLANIERNVEAYYVPHAMSEELEKLRFGRQRLMRALHLVRRELIDTKAIDKAYLIRLLDEGFAAAMKRDANSAIPLNEEKTT